MKKFSFFLIALLIVLGVSLAFVIQNNSTAVTMRFLFWSFPQVSLGLLAIMLFLAGLVSMWLISLMIYIGSILSNRRRLSEKETLIKTIEKEKEEIKTQLENKTKEFQSKIQELEDRLKTAEAKSEEPPKKEEA